MSSPKLAAAASPNQTFAPLRNAPADRPFVVAQLGQSLDGRIATKSGESRWINHALRPRSPARPARGGRCRVVGVGTVLADDPRLNVRRVPGRIPGAGGDRPLWQSAGHCRLREGRRRGALRGADGAGALPGGVEPSSCRVRREHLSRSHCRGFFARGLKRILHRRRAWTVSRSSLPVLSTVCICWWRR